MFGLTPLGIFHLAISLVALVAGVILLVREGRISSKDLIGQVYVACTVVACATALGIYQHGGFGKAHILAILTLVVLGVALAAERTTIFGGASRYAATISYSATFLFHMIPGITEAFTRLPPGAPIAASGEDPVVKMATGLLLLLFVIGVTLQVRSLRSQA